MEGEADRSGPAEADPGCEACGADPCPSPETCGTAWAATCGTGWDPPRGPRPLGPRAGGVPGAREPGWEET